MMQIYIKKIKTVKLHQNYVKTISKFLIYTISSKRKKRKKYKNQKEKNPKKKK